MKNYVTNEQVITLVEGGRRVYVDTPEGSTIELTDIEEAKRYLASYLQYCDFYVKEEKNMQEKKLDLIFSTTDKDGDATPERVVRHLIAGYAGLHSMDGYTLNKALTGYWRGKEEDSYTLTVICFSQSDYNKAYTFLTKLSSAIKRLYNQDETLLTETDIRVL